jgi:hypothetical protein
VAAADPGRAERITRLLTGEAKATAPAEVATVMAATAPDRAGRLIDVAEHIAQSITDAEWKARTLAEVAMALEATDKAFRATADIAEAERVAQSITN